MKKIIIISVVALITCILVLSPIFVETPKILISADKLATISPYYDFQTNTADIQKQDILKAQGIAQSVNLSRIKQMKFHTAAVILESLPKNSQKLTLLGEGEEGRWWKTNMPIGYFQTITDLKISSGNIIGTVSGNTGNSIFLSLMTLGACFILILLISIKQATISTA